MRFSNVEMIHLEGVVVEKVDYLRLRLMQRIWISFVEVHKTALRRMLSGLQ